MKPIFHVFSYVLSLICFSDSALADKPIHQQEYALYLQGRSPTQLSMHLPEGRWKVEWLNIENGKSILSTTVAGIKNETVTLTSPDFKDAVALRLILE